MVHGKPLSSPNAFAGWCSRLLCPVAVLLPLLPALAAVWAFPGFVTQDGPAHLYNAQVLVRSLGPGSVFQDVFDPFRNAFEVRWEPLPNWAGHLALMGLVQVAPPRVADRLMTSLTLVAFAGSMLWLRGRVAGETEPGLERAASAMLAAVLGLNIAWLFGFASFLLGAALFPVTLGAWWSGRDRGFSWRRAAGLSALMVLGYFCHLVSLGLTAVGLVVLELLTPGRDRSGRSASTALGLSPLLPLAGIYLRLMHRGGGAAAPEWAHLAALRSPRAWLSQLTWVDPISLARKDMMPLSWPGTAHEFAAWCVVFAPVLWLAGGLAVAVWQSARRGLPRAHRGWWALAALLVVGGAIGPDTLGPSHGHYLPQRIVLLGLAAALPVLRFGPVSSALIAAALLLQSLTVWNYARASEETAGRLIQAARAVKPGDRVAVVLIDIATGFRANPLLHADCALGANSGSIIWGDYETRFYYFPVHFRAALDHPDPADLEAIALDGHPSSRARRWASILDRHRQAIDVVVVWGNDSKINDITMRFYKNVYSDGAVRALRRAD